MVDSLVRSRDYLAADQYPTITFRLDKLTQTSKQTADVQGRITLRGVTRPVSFTAEGLRLRPGHGRPRRFEAGFNLTGQIDRTDFGSTGGLPEVAAVLPVHIRLLMTSQWMRLRDGTSGWGWAPRPCTGRWRRSSCSSLGFGLDMIRLVPDLLARFTLTQTHKSWGSVIFLLALVRVARRLGNPARPPLPADAGLAGARRPPEPRAPLRLHVPDARLRLAHASASPIQDLLQMQNLVFGASPCPTPSSPRRGPRPPPRRRTPPPPSPWRCCSRSTPAPRFATSSSTATAFWPGCSAAPHARQLPLRDLAPRRICRKYGRPERAGPTSCSVRAIGGPISSPEMRSETRRVRGAGHDARPAPRRPRTAQARMRQPAAARPHPHRVLRAGSPAPPPRWAPPSSGITDQSDLARSPPRRNASPVRRTRPRPDPGAASWRSISPAFVIDFE